MSQTVDVLDVRSLSKNFPGQVALDHAHITVRAGQIHALLGQNGSGKSTLIKLLAGYHKPDPGSEVFLAGEPLHLEGLTGGSGGDRIRVMHQDIGLVGSLNVMENLALGRGFHSTRAGKILWSAERRWTKDLLHDFGLDVSPRREVSTLSPAEQAIVGLARAMQDWDPEGGLLILDEPTASLPKPEVERLFTAVRRVAARGAGILFVTHRLDEVFELAEWVTVLRDARTVASVPIEGLDHDALVQLIVGRPVEDFYTDPPQVQRESVYEAEGVWGDVVESFNLRVHRGEIVGIAGIVGSGREEIGPLLGGTRHRAKGRIQVGSRPVGSNPSSSLAAGVGFVPADRKNLGSIQNQSVAANIVLGRMRSLFSTGWLTQRGESREALGWIQKVDLRPAEPQRMLSTLSGGNQQKAVLARVLRLDPAVVVLDEPTQGVDVGAKATIYSLLADAARRGAGIVIVSSEAEELANICDRVLVLRHGRVCAELHEDRLTPEAIVEQSLR